MPTRKWYVRRLRTMSAREVVARSRQQARILTERARWRMGGYVLGEQALVQQLRPAYRSQDGVWATLLANGYRDGLGPLLLSPHERVSWVDWLGTQQPAVIDRTLEQAGRLCRGETRLFGHTFQLDFADAQVWMRDPLTEKVWPRQYWSLIDFRDGRTVGGAKWVWELNRHAHLITLAKAFFLSNDEEYALEVRRQLISWIGVNSPYTGINWTSPIEAALRLMSWSWVMAFMHSAHAFDADLFRAVNRAVFQQAQFILQHLSTHSSANNHLIGEATGLIVCGVSFPWFEESDQWIETGRAILIREAQRQFHPDGVGAEQAFAYQQFVLEMYLSAGLLLQRQGNPFPGETTERLERACLFLRAVADADGSLPDIGDRDDGRAFPLDGTSGPCPLPTLLNLAAAVLGQDDLHWPTVTFDETLFWLTGNQAAPATPGSLHFPERTSQAFPWGGYYVLRGPHHSILTFDCGPLGYLAMAAHGHADALSITLRAHGQPLLIDPGTYAYHEAPAWRAYFRGTRAHNTVTVDGSDQSRVGGPFMWTKHARAKCHRWVSAAGHDYVDGSHDGYASIGVTHRRRLIYLRPNQWVIVDDLTGKGDHHLLQTWHLAREAVVYSEPLAIYRRPTSTRPAIGEPMRVSDRKALSLPVAPGGMVRVGDAWLSLVPLPDDLPIESRLTWGWLARIQGWVSSFYGHKAAAPVLSFGLRGPTPLRLITVLQVEKGKTAPDFQPASKVWQRAQQVIADIEGE